MRAFVYHFSFEFFSGLRNKSLFLMNYLLPLGFYMMMGLMMAEINPLFVETMIPAMVVFAILSAMILGLPNPLVEAREAGIFRSFRINGVPVAAIVLMPVLATLIHTAVVTVIIVTTAPVFFSAPAPENGGLFVVIFLLTAFTCAGLGSLIGVVSANVRVTILWSQLIYLPSMMLSGMMVPVAMLPEALTRVSRLLPAHYAMEAYNMLTMGREGAYAPVWALLILFAGGLLAISLSFWLFNWDSSNPHRRSHWLALLALLPYVLGAVLLPLVEMLPLP